MAGPPMTTKRKPGRPRGGPGINPRLPGVTVPAPLVELVNRAADHRALSQADWLRWVIAGAALDDAIEDPAADAAELLEIVAQLAGGPHAAPAKLAADWLPYLERIAAEGES